MDRRLPSYAIVAIGLACLSGGATPTQAPGGPGPDVAAESESRVVQVAAFLESCSTNLLEAEIAALAPVIVEEARRAGLDPELILAVIHVESSSRNFAISRAGAMGLMQLRPSTAEAVAERIGIDWHGPATLFDPVSNVRLGVSYLDSLLERFGDLPTALAAYNEGPTRVAAHLRRGRSIPVRYSERVLATRDTATRKL